MIFLFAGLKYHDTTVRIKSNDEGNNSVTGSLTAICENIAPDMMKKKPGMSTAMVPKIFQMPSIVKR